MPEIFSPAKFLNAFWANFLVTAAIKLFLSQKLEIQFKSEIKKFLIKIWRKNSTNNILEVIKQFKLKIRNGLVKVTIHVTTKAYVNKSLAHVSSMAPFVSPTAAARCTVLTSSWVATANQLKSVRRKNASATHSTVCAIQTSAKGAVATRTQKGARILVCFVLI